MYILLILYFLFLLAYIAFSSYVIFRINKMRMKGDLTTRGIVIYMMVMSIILVISCVVISTLNWQASIFGGRLGL